MNTRKHLTISLALTALTMGLANTQAIAQQPGFKGSFELPQATYVGDALLRSGHYSIRISTQVHDLDHVLAIQISGEGVTKTFLTISKPQRESENNFLRIADLDGTYVLRALDAGMLGRSFSFRVTKNVSKSLEARAGSTIAVPVSSGTTF